MSLFKTIPITERYSLQLRLEAYNVLNHRNFNNKYYPTGATNNAGVTYNGPWQPGTPFSISKTATTGVPITTPTLALEAFAWWIGAKVFF